MESNQVHIIAASVFCNAQQILHTLEPGFPSDIVSNVFHRNLRNRIDDNMSLVHRVTTADFYMRPLPDANAGLDSAVSYSVAKFFGEHHNNTQ